MLSFVRALRHQCNPAHPQSPQCARLRWNLFRLLNIWGNRLPSTFHDALGQWFSLFFSIRTSVIRKKSLAKNGYDVSDFPFIPVVSLPGFNKMNQECLFYQRHAMGARGKIFLTHRHYRRRLLQ